MIKKVYCVYDGVAKLYLAPFLELNAGTATRHFAEACKDPSTNLYKHPADFTLFEIAEFDDNTGVYTPHVTQQNLGLALHYAPAAPELDPYKAANGGEVTTDGP